MRGRAARAGPDRPHRGPTSHDGAVLAALGRADRAADLAAVVHADGRAGRAGDRGRSPAARSGSSPRATAACTWTGWRTSARGASRASCGGATGSRSGTAAHEIYVGHRAARGRRLGARPRRARHVVPRARCGRSRRSAGPSDTPELRAFYPTDVLATGRDIIFLWVARMIMLGIEFTGADPVRRRLRALDHPGARRPADVQVAGHRDRPAGPDRGRPAPAGVRQGSGGEFPAYGADAVRWGLLAMSSAQDVRFSEDKVAQGQQLTNKLWNAVAADPARRRSRGARRGPAPTAVEDRWILSRLERAKAEIARADRALRLLPRRARPLRLRLRRAVRLVPRAGQAAAARRRAASVAATLLHVLDRRRSRWPTR